MKQGENGAQKKANLFFFTYFYVYLRNKQTHRDKRDDIVYKNYIYTTFCNCKQHTNVIYIFCQATITTEATFKNDRKTKKKMKQNCRRWRLGKWARCVKVGGRRHEITGCAMLRRVSDGDALWVGWGISWEIKIHPKIDEKTADELKRNEKKIGYLVVVSVCEREKEIDRVWVSLCVWVWALLGAFFSLCFSLSFSLFFSFFFGCAVEKLKRGIFPFGALSFGWVYPPNHPPTHTLPPSKSCWLLCNYIALCLPRGAGRRGRVVHGSNEYHR